MESSLDTVEAGVPEDSNEAATMLQMYLRQQGGVAVDWGWEWCLD